MPRITTNNVQAWLERAKLTLAALDLDFLEQLEEEVLVRLAIIYDTSVWVSPATTPLIVKTIISKKYASWHIDKAYSENQDEGNDYAARIDQNAEMLLTGLVGGIIEIPGITPTNPTEPSYYPNDASSAFEPTLEDPSLGPAKFSMGKVF